MNVALQGNVGFLRASVCALQQMTECKCMHDQAVHGIGYRPKTYANTGSVAMHKSSSQIQGCLTRQC